MRVVLFFEIAINTFSLLYIKLFLQVYILNRKCKTNHSVKSKFNLPLQVFNERKSGSLIRNLQYHCVIKIFVITLSASNTNSSSRKHGIDLCREMRTNSCEYSKDTFNCYIQGDLCALADLRMYPHRKQLMKSRTFLPAATRVSVFLITHQLCSAPGQLGSPWEQPRRSRRGWMIGSIRGCPSSVILIDW